MDQNELARLALDCSYHMEIVEGPDGAPLYVSPSAVRVTGRSSEEYLRKPGLFDSLVHAESRDDLRCHRQRLADGLDPQYVELRLSLSDRDCWVGRQSQVLLDPAGKRLGVRSTIWDMTAQKQLESNLAATRSLDPLTGLPNRLSCLRHIGRLLEQASQEERSFAAIYIDVDRLKVINDSMGPSCGDDLIRQVIQRTQKVLGDADHLFARLGGDEFMVVLNRSNAREAIRFVKTLQERIAAPFTICNTEVLSSVSMGIVLSPVLYNAPDDLLRNANIAVRRAKAHPRHRFKVFNSRLLEEAIKETEIERAMPVALKNGEFVMHYQPILDLEGKRVNGVEALLRWQHPRYGLLAPKTFLTIAERNDFIVPLGNWALKQSCRDMAAWQATCLALRDATMSVNLSAKQLARHDIVEVIREAIASSGIEPGTLKLEITETVAMMDPKLTLQRLVRIKEMGVRLSIDDFGTGYSSLSYLQSFPVDTVKVDKSFVGDMSGDSGKRKIVSSVIRLAHNLSMNVVAEGIEEHEHLSMLKAMDCELGQGFLFSRALPADKIIQLADELLRDSQAGSVPTRR
jgi:diguanylate cyclase (GGDEF)-like protein